MTSTAAGPDAAPGQRFLAQVVDLARYPLHQPGSPAWHAVAGAASHALRRDGCCVLRDFVPGEGREAVRRECESVAGRAYYDERIVNVYNTAPDPDLPPDHPARRTMLRGNAFVARDDIPGGFLIHRLYGSFFFRSFLAACLGTPVVHPLGDPLAGLVGERAAARQGAPVAFRHQRVRGQPGDAGTGGRRRVRVLSWHPLSG